MKKHDLFGLSSFIFIIASIYTILVVSSSYYFYTIFLILLPILSYLCNTRYNVFYQKLDHINTLCIGLSYLFIQQKYELCFLIIYLSVVEFVINDSVLYSTMISFILFSYTALSRFDILHFNIGIICLAITIIAFIKRNKYHSSYKLYTTIWHLCNTILLLFVADTLHN